MTVQQVLASAERGAYVLRPYPKSRSSVRTIRVPAEVVAELRAHRRRQLVARAAARRWDDESGLVFLSRYGTPHLPSNVLRALKRDAVRAGIGEDVRPHLLRHTFSSALLLAGRPVTEVAYLLGHATAATTLSVYAHWVRRGAGGAAAALSRAYQEQGPSPNSGADANTGSAGADR